MSQITTLRKADSAGDNRLKSDNLKFYAAFRSGCLGENILNVYFSFFANIIIEEDWQEITAKAVSEKFQEKYNFPVPMTFVRQVLGVGINDGSIVSIRGRYEIVREKINLHKADMSAMFKFLITILMRYPA